MKEKIENALKKANKNPGFICVEDYDCLDNIQQMYYVWLKYPENVVIKVLQTFKYDKDGNFVVN